MTDLTTTDGVARLALGECDGEIERYVEGQLAEVLDENLVVASLDEIHNLSAMIEQSKERDRKISLAVENAISGYLVELQDGLAPEVVTLVRRRLSTVVMRVVERILIKKAGEQIVRPIGGDGKVVIQ